MQYEYRHPNYGWQDVDAPCDARNFQILSDWEVRSYDDPYYGHTLFTLVQHSDGTILEVVESSKFNNGHPTQVTQCPSALDRGLFYFHPSNLTDIECKVFMTCPASNPIGMRMPLKLANGDKFWFFEIPEEVFGVKGAVIRMRYR